MKILSGIYHPDAGEIRLAGQPIHLNSVHEAQQAGIVLIHQELNLAQSLDVAGNIFLGREPRRAGPLRLLDSRIYAEADAIIRRLGLTVGPRTSVASLSIGQQQLVEIARSLSLQSRVLILDEPTSSLSTRDTERLFAVIRDLKQSGVGILYISHRLPEVREIADRVTVLRDGQNAGELSRGEITHAALVRLMIGRDLKQFFVRGGATTGGREATAEAVGSGQQAAGSEDDAGDKVPQSPDALTVTGLKLLPGQQSGIDFIVRRGEIVGLAGLVGAGRTELAEALFGIRRPAAGSIRVLGQEIKIRSPRDAIAAGLLLVPEDRRVQGLFLANSVRRNISLASLDFMRRFGLVRVRQEARTG